MRKTAMYWPKDEWRVNQITDSAKCRSPLMGSFEQNNQIPKCDVGIGLKWSYILELETYNAEDWGWIPMKSKRKWRKQWENALGTANVNYQW